MRRNFNRLGASKFCSLNLLVAFKFNGACTVNFGAANLRTLKIYPRIKLN